MKITELKTGEKGTFNFLLTDVEEKVQKNGDPYVQLHLTDGESKIKATRWRTKKQAVERYINTVVKVELDARAFNGSPVYDISSLEMTKEPVADYIRSAPVQAEMMLDKIIGIILKRKDSSLSELTIRLLDENKEKLLSWAGAKTFHHAFLSGLLYHTYRMVELADVTADIYGSLDAELLVCGAALHDIGKVCELDTNELGLASYNITGNMLGHIIIGIEMIDEFVIKSGIHFDKVMELKHMIASHHGTGENGSPVVPKCPEAMVLHHIDMIDSRIEMAEEAYPALEAGEISENNVMGLNVRLYRTK